MATRIRWSRLNFGVPLAVTVGLSVSLLGCGAEAPLHDEQVKSRPDTASNEIDPEETGAVGLDQPASGKHPDAPEEDGSSRDREIPGELSPDLRAALEIEAQAPGFVDAAYPPPPYGVGVGSVMADLGFFGWWSPRDAGYSDLNRASVIQLSDFYDPDGEKGIELLMINASAVWCGACQAEFTDIRDSSIYETLQPRGLEMLGVLFEDGSYEPARYVDLQTWSRVFQVGFPLVLDPGFKLGVFFDRSFTPMNMLVDARTMKILYAATGYSPDLFPSILRELEARGR